MSLGHCKETLPEGLRETFSTPGARSLSWSLWPSHPTASPWFGWGTGLAIPRKCLPPVQAGIPAYTPLESLCVCVLRGGGRWWNASFSPGQGEFWGPPGGPHPAPSLLGKCPVQRPFPGHPPPPGCAGA